ncbi:hypothetical protein A2Z22_01770 [Candidatus Woesebacteria bacterium RBG_16_34_12]|uniref:Uncharacterized protein n=1 Tax=Candidatus Woesebacteria bacterium RBG_16_34_12 TaxID=1802480 RepID=A0A1F7X826_9BACT|nr:MAG: hypothetical protein A2Z22_01770 [Candidatus Woesebacteria bacterium RBG_16_34_12]
MINRKFFVIILLIFSLLGLAGFALTTGNATSSDINTLNTETIGNTPSANADLSGPQITEAQVLPEYQVTGSKFSGEVLTCTNLTDYEQVIDLKISNLMRENISVNIDYPFSRTIELHQNESWRIDLPLPYGVTSVDLSSNDEKLTLQVPPCIIRGGSGGNSESSFSSSNGDSQIPPPPVPELSTIALTGIGMLSMIFIISRSKQ